MSRWASSTARAELRALADHCRSRGECHFRFRHHAACTRHGFTWTEGTGSAPQQRFRQHQITHLRECDAAHGECGCIVAQGHVLECGKGVSSCKRVCGGGEQGIHQADVLAVLIATHSNTGGGGTAELDAPARWASLCRAAAAQELLRIPYASVRVLARKRAKYSKGKARVLPLALQPLRFTVVP